MQAFSSYKNEIIAIYYTSIESMATTSTTNTNSYTTRNYSLSVLGISLNIITN